MLQPCSKLQLAVFCLIYTENALSSCRDVCACVCVCVCVCVCGWVGMYGFLEILFQPLASPTHGVRGEEAVPSQVRSGQ